MNVFKKKRNLLITLLLAVMLLCAAGIIGTVSVFKSDKTAYALEVEPFVPELSYMWTYNSYKVIGFNTSSEAWINMTAAQKANIKVVIPDMFDDGVNGNYKVAKIDDGAFALSQYSDCKITSLDLTKAVNIVEIGTAAFSGRSEIKGSLTLPSNLSKIDMAAFFKCSGFTGDLILPDNLKEINANAFNGCTGFSGNLTIPGQIKDIGQGAFGGCTGFKGNLTFPSNLNFIQQDAFSGCTGFTGDLTIPNSVTYLGSGAFNGCQGFNGSLTISENINQIYFNTFKWCSKLSGTLTIPSKVTAIGMSAFNSCRGFEGKLIIPDSVKVIGDEAFTYAAITDVQFPDGLETIGESAFASSKLSYGLTLPDSIKSIGKKAFYNCRTFGAFNIPKNPEFTTISESAFELCRFTGTLEIPNNVTTIESYAFKDNENLSGDLIIPNSVTSIGKEAFKNCTYIDGKIVLPDNAAFTTITEGSFFGMIRHTGNLIIPENVTSIETFAFFNNQARFVHLNGNATYGTSPFWENSIVIAKSKELYDAYKETTHNLSRFKLTYEFTVTFEGVDGKFNGAASVTRQKLYDCEMSAKKDAETGYWDYDYNDKFPIPNRPDYFFEYYCSTEDGTSGEKVYPNSTVDYIKSSTYYAQYEMKILTSIGCFGDYPDKTVYHAYEDFDPTGMIIKARYEGKSDYYDITGYTILDGTNLKASAEYVTISFTEAGITQTAIVSIKVYKKEFSTPWIYGTYTYNGSEQTAVFDEYFDSKYMEATNHKSTTAGKKTAIVTLKDPENCIFASNSATYEIPWEIKKATPSVTAKYDAEAKVYVGGSLPEISVNESFPGVITWNSYNLTTPSASKSFTWTFKPTDNKNYNNATGTVKFAVIAEELASISATFNQGENIIYESNSLDSLKQYLEVYGTNTLGSPFNGGAKITNYTLSGDLTSSGEITVSYSGKETTFTVSVTAKMLESLSTEFSQGTIKIFTSCSIGDLKTLLNSSLVVLKNFNNGTSEEATDYTLSGDLSIGGNRTITVSLNGKTTTFTVSVTEVELESISATFTQGQEVIYSTDSLDSLKKHLEVFGMNNDGNAHNGGAKITDYTLSGDLTVSGTVTINFGGKETTFTVNVTAVTLERISAEFNQGTIKVYTSTNINDLNNLLGSSLIIKKHYNNGQVIVTTSFTLTGEISVAGLREITAQAESLQTTFNIDVLAVELAAISAEFNQNNAVIYSSADLSGLKQFLIVSGLNNDGTIYTGAIDFTLSGKLTGGSSEIFVTVNGTQIKTSFLVNVTAVELKSITVTFNQNENVIYSFATLDSLKQYLTLSGINNDGSVFSETINYSLSGTLSVGASKITVTVNDTDISGEFNVVVTETALQGIHLTANPTKTAYKAFENFDKTGMVITATFSHGTEVINDYVVEGGDNLNAGTTIVRVSYSFNGVKKTIEVAITVNKIELSKPTASGTYTFNKNAQSLTINGFDDSLMSVTGNSGTNAGNYSAVVSLNDKDNYAWVNGSTENLTLSWSISKATIDMSGVSIKDKTVKENGSNHTLVVTGILPSGVNVSYSGTNGYGLGGVSGVGEYEITASFKVDDEINYVLPEPISATLTINMAELSGKDDNSGTTVTISDSGEGLKPGTTLSVTEKAAAEFSGKDFEISNLKHTVLQANDITLKNNGVTVQPNGSVKVKILIKDALRGYDNLKVVYIAADGSIKDMNAVREGDYMVFETNHFSLYAVVAPIVVEDNKGLSGGIIALIVIAIILVVLILIILLMFLLRKDKSQGFKAFFVSLALAMKGSDKKGNKNNLNSTDKQNSNETEIQEIESIEVVEKEKEDK